MSEEIINPFLRLDKVMECDEINCDWRKISLLINKVMNKKLDKIYDTLIKERSLDGISYN